MKRKFSRILGVGLALVLALALGAPLMADVSDVDVDVDEDEISKWSEYKVTFTLHDAIDIGADAWIEIRFPEDTEIRDEDGGAFDGTANISATAGIGSVPFTFSEQEPEAVTVDDLTITIDLTTLGWFADNVSVIGRLAAVEVWFSADIRNPSEPDDYTLEVRTSEEDDWVESASYEIGTPVVGGGVYVYNAADILVETYGGGDALNDAWLDDYFEEDDFIIRVGPGTYELEDGNITITGDGFTLKSSDGADDTIIDGDEKWGIIINGEDVTIDGFTVEDAGTTGIAIQDEGAVVKNCIIIEAGDEGIVIDADEATVEDNVIEDCPVGIQLADGASDATISDNEITGCTEDDEGAIVFEGDNEGNTISGNTITENEGSGIYFTGDDCGDNVIEGNTISDNEENGIWIDSTDNVTELVITGNDISDNDEVGIVIEWWDVTNAITFNNISQEDAIETVNVDVDVDATFNWWGTTDDDDIADMITEDGDGEVVYEPFLTGTQDAIFAGAIGTVVNDDDLDARDEAGVKVSGVKDDDDVVADVIKAARYVANPQDYIADSLAFFDVYVLLNEDFVVDEDVIVKLKFYDVAFGENDLAHFWTGDFWAECSDQLARSGLVWVNLTEDSIPTIEELEGMAFAVVAGEEEVEALTCPQCGLIFDTAAELKAHWDATHKPAPPVAPVITVEAPPAPPAPPAPSVTVEAPPAPPAPPAPVVEVPPAIPPAILWVIIGIGAVLVIALIVLIVRTRRVV